LEKDDFKHLSNYFFKKEKLKEIIGFLNFRVGEKDNFIQLNKNLNTGITFRVPRHSLMVAVEYEIFDDLLIGNYMKTTLHNIESLYKPNFNLYVTKIADNGRAQTLDEIREYFKEYKRRAFIDYLLSELQSTSITFIRNIIHSNNRFGIIARKIKSSIRERQKLF